MIAMCNCARHGGKLQIDVDAPEAEESSRSLSFFGPDTSPAQARRAQPGSLEFISVKAHGGSLNGP